MMTLCSEMKITRKQQENRWKQRMLPKWLLSIKGRTRNLTPLDCTPRHAKETTFYEKQLRRDNSSEM